MIACMLHFDLVSMLFGLLQHFSENIFPDRYEHVNIQFTECFYGAVNGIT